MKQFIYNTIYLILILMIDLAGCTTRPQKQPVLTAAAISQVITEMTEVMIHDITAKLVAFITKSIWKTF
jgi:hypothetical protein